MRSVFLTILLGAVMFTGPFVRGLSAADEGVNTVAVRELKRQFPEARSYRGGDIVSVYGTPMTEGATPDQAANRFLARHANIFGAPNLELSLDRRNVIKNGLYTVFAYHQTIDGVPVEDGMARILVLNGLENRVVMASGRIEQTRATSFPADRVTGAQALELVSNLPAYGGLTDWSQPELVIFRGELSTVLEDPIRTWRFFGSTENRVDFESYRFFINADNGDLVHVRDEVYQVDVSGTVTARLTPGVSPDEVTNPPVVMPLENVRVEVQGGNSVFTNPDGTYTIPNGGAGDVTVNVDLIGEWVQVATDQGTLVSGSQVVTPPGPADFELNSAPAEFNTAQVNAFHHTTNVHNFITDRSSFTGLDISIVCNTNLASSCNAFFSPANLDINFFNAQGGCVNTAYADVVYHEYGHFVVNRLGLGQGAFGEGFGDCLAFYGLDIQELGFNFFGPGSFVRQPLVDNVQFPCPDTQVHFCGQILGGLNARMKNGFKASLGDGPGLAYAQQLFVDWALITLGGQGANSAHPQTAIEVLMVDDNDGNLNNGTPNRTVICDAFAAHSILCPDLPGLSFIYPNGIPSTVLPGQSTTVRVNVNEGGVGNPISGTGTVSIQVNGGGFSTSSMTELVANEYEFALPASGCFDVIEFFVSAEAVNNTIVSDPEGGASEARSALVATGTVNVFSDDFQSDNGWTVTNTNLLDGGWERGAPAGDGSRLDPLVDGDGSGQCFLTDNVIGNSDVDGGPTTVTSPTFDGSNDGIVSYFYWHASTGSDPMDVEVSNNGGSTWTLVTTYLGASLGWNQDSFKVSDFVTPSANMAVRFAVEDNPNDSITESGVDGFSFDGFDCDDPTDQPDLAIQVVQVDFDPNDGDIDAGPGGISQAVNVVATILNDGNTTITQATIMADAMVSGGLNVSTSTVFNGSLAPGNSADVVLSYTAGQLNRCGDYDLTVSHDAPNLMSTGTMGAVMGDNDGSDDSVSDTTTLQLDFGTFGATIPVVSQVIEDAATEKVKVDIDYMGLGPGGDSHDIQLQVDLTDLSGATQYLNVFNRTRNNVGSGGSRMVRIRFGVDSLFPAPTPGSAFRVLLRIFDVNSGETCIRTLTTDSFVIQ